MRALVADALLLGGLAILTLGVLGVLRMPDVYTQAHAASKAGFLGIAGLLASASVRGDLAILARSVLIVALLAVTTPVAAHAIGRAAHRRREPMRSAGAVDER